MNKESCASNRSPFSKPRLPPIESCKEPLAPVAIDLELGGPPHEIQTFDLG